MAKMMNSRPAQLYNKSKSYKFKSKKGEDIMDNYVRI